MTKRVALLLTAIAMVGGTAWAQATEPMVPGVPDGVFHDFNAVPTLSTEARYSAGRFTSDVDNFINPRFHNPEIGTFFFLGGFPRQGFVEDTNVLTPSDFTISFGFAHTFNAFYLAVYYGGSFVHAAGARVEDTSADGHDTREREALWQNNLAVLVGIMNMGIRLDFIQANNRTERRSVDDYLGPGDVFTGIPDGIPGRVVENAPSLAVTWGMRMGRLAPFVQIGYQFRNQEIWSGWYGRYEHVTLPDGTVSPVPELVGHYEVEYRRRTGGAFGMSAGARFELNDTARVGGSLRFGSRFAESDQFTWNSDTDSVTAAGGAWGLGLNVYYVQNIDAGIVAVGFRPRLDLAFARETRSDSIVEDHARYSPFNHFSMGIGAEFGIRVRPTQRFALFTGAGLNLFGWNVSGHSESDVETLNRSAWTVSGLSWDANQTTASGHLGFGLTFTPVENVVIGFGLNSIIDQFFGIDLYRMQFETGSWWTAANDRNNFVSQLGSVFSDITVDLTVSVRLGGNNGNGNRAAAPAPAPAAPAAYDGNGDDDNGDE